MPIPSGFQQRVHEAATNIIIRQGLREASILKVLLLGSRGRGLRTLFGSPPTWVEREVPMLTQIGALFFLNRLSQVRGQIEDTGTRRQVRRILEESGPVTDAQRRLLEVLDGFGPGTCDDLFHNLRAASLFPHYEGRSSVPAMPDWENSLSQVETLVAQIRTIFPAPPIPVTPALMTRDLRVRRVFPSYLASYLFSGLVQIASRLALHEPFNEMSPETLLDRLGLHLGTYGLTTPPQRLTPVAPAGSVSFLAAGTDRFDRIIDLQNQLLSDGLIDGAIWLTPNHTSSDTLYARFFESVRCRFTHVPPVVLVDRTSSRVSGFDQDENRPWPPNLQNHSWFLGAPDLSLVGPFAIASFDQALAAMIRVLNGKPNDSDNMRFASLVGRLVVFNGLSLTQYGGRLVEQLIHELLTCGSHVLITDDFITPATACRIISPYPQTASTLDIAFVETTSSVWSDRREPLPIVRTPLRPTITRRPMHVNFHPWGTFTRGEEPAFSDDNCRRIFNYARQGAKVGVVMSTFNSCRIVHEALREYVRHRHGLSDLIMRVHSDTGDHPMNLHSYWSAEDRRLVENTIQQVFGPGPTRSSAGCIIVSTPLLTELDIDVDVLVTNITDMGTFLNRALKVRPFEGLERPNLDPTILVLHQDRNLTCLMGGRGTPNGSLGLTNIHRNYFHLEATYRALEARSQGFTLPDDGPALLEEAFSSTIYTTLISDPRWGARWSTHREFVEKANQEENGGARSLMLDRTQHFSLQVEPPSRLSLVGGTRFLAGGGDNYMTRMTLRGGAVSFTGLPATVISSPTKGCLPFETVNNWSRNNHGLQLPVSNGLVRYGYSGPRFSRV